jgi:two-component system, chemotaxis family, chemotaxis protein CheY
MSKRILVIDDDAAVCATVEHILKRAGEHVVSALSVSQAFALADSQAFDLLISDLMMPEEDGVVVIRKFKDRFPHMPVVAMSGGARLGTVDTLASARAAGADELLRKPFNTESLMAAVGAALGK